MKGCFCGEGFMDRKRTLEYKGQGQAQRAAPGSIRGGELQSRLTCREMELPVLTASCRQPFVGNSHYHGILLSV
jgi:hypothetical protein